jgi:tetratricopeptide (TPR) repeat protein
VSKGQGAGALANGSHDRMNFVRVFFALYKHQRSGRLEVRFGRKSRQLLLLGGEPVAYISDLPEDDLSRTLVNSGLVPGKQMTWIKDKLSEGESLEEALLMSGAINAQQLAEHKRNRMKVGIGAPLQWGSGEWSFVPRPMLKVDRIDPKLRPTVDSLSAIWNAVQHHVSMDAVFPHVSDPKAGEVSLDPICPALFSGFQVDEPLNSLTDVIGSGIAVDDIFRKVPDSSGNLVKLLWFLEAAGLIHRAGRAPETEIEDDIAAAYKTPQGQAGKTAAKARPKPSAARAAASKPARGRPDTKAKGAKPPPAETPERKRAGVLTDDQLEIDYLKRIGRDFYAFLGLPSGTPAQAIDKKCKGLARRWRAAKADRSLPPAIASKVDALLAGVQLVWRTLTDKGHRKEYDRRLSQGRAPTVEDAQVKKGGNRRQSEPAPEAAPEQDDVSLAHAHMKDGHFDQALSLLKKARLDDPSSPDVMAALGWTTWKLRGDKGGDAEEFLKLALTFDPRHANGLEWLSRIKVEQGELDAAKKLLQQLVRVAEDPSWARTALRNLTSGRGGR